MKTLSSWVAVLLPVAVLADGPPEASMPQDGRFVVELSLEVKNDDAEGRLQTTLVSQNARKLSTGADGFEIAFGPERLTGEVTAEAVPETPPRQFRVAVRLRHKDQVVGAATLTTLDRQSGQIAVTLNPGSEDKLAIFLAATVSDPHPPAREADRQTSDGPSKEERRIAAALEKKVSLHFEDVPLHKVMAEIRSIGDINIVIDNAGLEQEGVTSDTPVSLDVDDVMVWTALTTLLEPLNLGYTIDKEVLKITSRLRAKGPLVFKTYPVADLVVPLRIVTADGETEGKADEVRPAVAVEAEPTGLEFDDLLDLITGAIQPGSWEQVGGYGVIRVNEARGSLVVRQTQDVHEEIGDLLRHLRRLRDAAAKIEGASFRVEDGNPKPLTPATPQDEDANGLKAPPAEASGSAKKPEPWKPGDPYIVGGQEFLFDVF